MRDQLLSPTNIAELASVSRPVVSNWRRRNPDFPQPVGGTESRPLFSREEVIAWLTERDYEVKEEDTVATIWSSLNTLRGSVDFAMIDILTLLLLTLRQHLPETFDDIADAGPDEKLDLLAEAEAELREGYPTDDRERLALDVRDVLRGVDANALQPLLSAVQSAERSRMAEYADELMSRFNRESRMGSTFGSIGARSSTLLASLAKETQGTVYDPASGIANSLVQVAQHRRARTLIGSDISTNALILACLRSMLSGSTISFVLGDVLADDPVPDLQADVIIAEVPFGPHADHSTLLSDPRFRYGIPSRMGGDLLWVQHALAHLAPGGRAYLVTTTGALRRSRVDQDVRTELIKAGCIEAIVSLPGRLLPSSAVSTVLWVLRNPDASSTDVLLVDASETPDAENVVPTWFTGAPITAPHLRVDVTDIIAEGSALTPALWIGATDVDPSEISGRVADSSEALEQKISSLATVSVDIDSLAGLSEARIVTIERLIEMGIVERRPGRHRKSPDSSENSAIITSSHVAKQSLPEPLDTPALFPMEETEPGDVLISTMNVLNAMVDTTGNHHVALGVERLRVLDRSVLTPEFLALAVTGKWNERFRDGVAIRRIPVTDLEIPLLPLEEQERLCTVTLAVRALERDAEELIRHSRSLTSSLLEAVRHHVPIGQTPSRE